MKKLLSVVLSLILILVTALSVPTVTASAEGVTAASFTDGVIWHLSEGGDIDYLRLTNGWGSYTGANGSVTITDPSSCRSTMANITGFTAGKTYEISFSATGISGVLAVLNYDSAYFNTDQIASVKAGCESDLVRGTLSNGIATITVTPTSDNIYLIVKNSAGTVTLSSFSVTVINDSDTILSGVNDGLTWTLSEGGNIDYLRLTSGWGFFVSSNGSVTITDPNSCRSTMANITGFTAGETYEISFSATGISGVFAVLNYDSAYFNTDQIASAKSGCESDLVGGTLSNGIATITVTPTSNNIYLIVKNIAGTVTLSNFEIATIDYVEPEANPIVSGEWYNTGSGSVEKNEESGTVTADTTYHCAYTTVTGLEPNTKYEFSCNYDLVGLYTVYFVNSSLTAPLFDDSVYSGNCPDIAQEISIANGKLTFTFITEAIGDKYTLVFKHNEFTDGAITYSNFKLEKMSEYSDVSASNELAKGDWKYSAGSLTKNNDGSVTANTPWHTVYTKLPLLPGNSLVKLEMDFTQMGNNIEALYVVSAAEEFTVDGSTGNYSGGQTNLAAYSIENGKITAYFKTTMGRSGYYFALKHGSLSTTGITYGNFSIQVVGSASDVIATYNGNDIADGDWAVQYSGNGKITQDKVTHTVTQSGNSYQDIGTTITGLSANTTYVITADYTANDAISGAYVYPVSAGKWQTNSNIAVKTDDTDNCKITVTFSTDSQNTDYYMQFRHGVLENGDITYSNFKISPQKIVLEEEIRGAKIADGYWTAESPGNVKFSHNYITHTLTQSVNSYQRIYTKLDFLEPNTEYEFMADYTADDVIQAAYFIPAEQELDFANLSQYSKAYTTTNGVLRFSFMTSATGTAYYLMIYHEKLSDNEITYSNFKLRVKRTWSNEEQGALLTQNGWYVKGNDSATVTADSNAKTVTTNASNAIIYTQLTGLSLNTTYRITCNYTDTDSCISAVYIGRSEDFPFSNNLFDGLYNKATSSSIKNNYLQVTFKTSGSNNNYWLAIKQSSIGDGSISYSGFQMAIPGVTTVNDEFSEWTSPSSSATFTPGNSTVTASATSGSIYTKVSGLEFNTAYKLQFTHDATDGVKQFMVFPASESLTRSTYWLDGYYNGTYKDYMYSTTVNNAETKTTSIVFTTNNTNADYYFVLELMSGVSVTLSGFELSKFTELSFVGTAIRRADSANRLRQALRYKNTISGEVLNNGFNGLTVKEYGSLAADTEQLSGLPLVINESGIVGSANVKRGIAFNSTTSKIYEELSDGSVVFTAALINIASEKYSIDYTVRPYMIVTDGVNDFTVYGQPQVYSIFTVFGLIENEGTQSDRLTVYDILDNKPTVNTEYLTFKGLDVNNPTKLSVYNDTVISEDYKGMSGTVYHTYGYIMDDKTGRQYTDEQRLTELNRLANSGVKYCRTNFSAGWLWSSSGNFNYSASRMTDYINYCKALQSKGISVCMQTGWYLSDICLNNTGSNCKSYINGNGSDLYSEQTIYASCVADEYKLIGSDIMATGETVTEYYNRIATAALRYGNFLAQVLITAKASGVDNIDYLIYFTEPSYQTEEKPEGDYANEYLFICKTIKNVIEQSGYNDTVKHVGPNQGSVTTGEGLLKYVVTREPDLFDVLTAHFYPSDTNINNNTYYETCYNTFVSYLKALKDAGIEDKEFWVDEFYATVSSGNARLTKRQAMSGLQTIVGAICAQQLGIENIVMWQMFDQAWVDTTESSSEFENGIHITGTCPSLYVSDVPYASYYPLSTFMKYNSANSGASFATGSGESGGAQSLYIGAMRDDNGDLVITVVNIGDTEKLFTVNLEKEINSALYKYIVASDYITPSADASPVEYSRILSDVSAEFTDTIAPYSVAIYTTSTK